MSVPFKKTIVVTILLSFAFILLFSFARMGHGSSLHASLDCPFSAIGPTLCPQNIVAMVLHHLSAYRMFTHIPIPANFGVWAILVATLILSLFKLPNRVGVFYLTPPNSLVKKRLTRWLALHENSPTAF